MSDFLQFPSTNPAKTIDVPAAKANEEQTVLDVGTKENTVTSVSIEGGELRISVDPVHDRGSIVDIYFIPDQTANPNGKSVSFELRPVDSNQEAIKVDMAPTYVTGHSGQPKFSQMIPPGIYEIADLKVNSYQGATDQTVSDEPAVSYDIDAYRQAATGLARAPENNQAPVERRKAG